MTSTRPGIIAFVGLAFLATTVSASTTRDYFATHPGVFERPSAETTAVGRPWHVTFAASAPAVLRLDSATAAALVVHDNQRPTAFEYSDAYNTRRKIHMIASYATIPLFVAQYWAGEKLFDDRENSAAKSAHGALTIGIASLFAVNTVTGVWNLLEARKDPNGRTRRLVHGLMMLGADLGFVATGALAPDGDDAAGRSTHRTVAITSMGVAVASYVYMLVTR
jgi:hypothetical protein